MRLKTVFFATMLLSFFSVSIYGKINGAKPNVSNETPTMIEMESYKIRPRDNCVNNVNVKCYYQNENLYIEFECSEGVAQATVTNMGNGQKIQSSFLTNQMCVINIGNTAGLYEISVGTSVGCRYIGYLMI